MLHVAEAARVSVATVSALINGTATVSPVLSQRIEQAIRDIGYKRNAIARSLKMGTTRTIGLTVPHIVRKWTGPEHRWLLPYCAVVAPTLLLGADILGRIVDRPSEIQVGIITALLGAPFFIAVARRTRLSTT